MPLGDDRQPQPVSGCGKAAKLFVMNNFSITLSWCRVGLVAGLVLCCANSQAGDRIIMGGGTPPSRQVQGDDNSMLKDTRSGTELLKVLRDSSRNPTEFAPPVAPPKQLNRKEEQRLKNARDEKRNWIFADPAKNKDDDEAKNLFGVTELSLDDLEKKEDNSDYTLRDLPIGEARKGEFLKSPGQRRSDQQIQNYFSADSDEQSKASGSSLSVFGNLNDEESGAHTANELNLRNLLDTRISGPNLRSEPSLNQFFKDNAPSSPSRSHLAQRDQFKQFLNTPAVAGPSPMSDPINLGPDQTRLLSPATPAPGIPDGLRSIGRGPDPLTVGGERSRDMGRALDYGSSRMPLPGASLPSSYMQPNDPGRNRGLGGSSLFKPEMPRRGGL
jgi:hypothetical protein